MTKKSRLKGLNKNCEHHTVWQFNFGKKIAWIYIRKDLYIYISYLEKILKTTVTKILERIFASFLAGARR